jgi:hypothetical protein
MRCEWNRGFLLHGSERGKGGLICDLEVNCNACGMVL